MQKATPNRVRHSSLLLQRLVHCVTDVLPRVAHTSDESHSLSEMQSLPKLFLLLLPSLPQPGRADATNSTNVPNHTHFLEPTIIGAG